MKITKEQLIKFEEKIAQRYKNGEIRSPVHLSGNNEQQLIKVFSKFKKGDWCFGTHRSHFQYILAGGSEKKLEKMILNNQSMHIYDKSINFFTSAIVGGIAPIAVGVALSLKKKKSKNKVWVFLGDMSYYCGIVLESIRYAENFDLPIKFIIEDNNLSVDAPTKEVWGLNNKKNNKVIRYKYKRKYKHHGTGDYVVF